MVVDTGIVHCMVLVVDTISYRTVPQGMFGFQFLQHCRQEFECYFGLIPVFAWGNPLSCKLFFMYILVVTVAKQGTNMSCSQPQTSAVDDDSKLNWVNCCIQ